ncbi:MAG: hypothetical protein ACYC0X_14960 [Pirellulaceae bacterium]
MKQLLWNVGRSCCLAACLLFAAPHIAADAAGPLRIHPTNPRYFTDGARQSDGSYKAVLLTGSHSWPNLIDRGPTDPPPVFDFTAYLALLQEYHHNFIRLWSRHVTWYHGYGEGELHAAPLAWQRTGPGPALDGKPKFDLTKFHQPYFDRLRTRVIAARDRNIYVSIMLFGGSYECRGGWQGNPFHSQNNVNGIDGDTDRDGEGPESHTLQVPAITRIQEAYVRKVVATVNDLDNVLYEVSNEGEDSSREWQYALIHFIHTYEAQQPKQHPVGMTAIGSGDAESNRTLTASAAEWISPHTAAWGGVGNTPPADGIQVSILDSDHWFVVELYSNPLLGRAWVWKAFCRGHNPILMEHLPPQSMVLPDCPVSLDDPGYVASRRAMGQVRRIAEGMDLATMTPHAELASTKYCLAHPGREYLVYQPEPDKPFSLELKSGSYLCDWLDPATGKAAGKRIVESSGTVFEFRAPFRGDAVLYLQSKSN